MRARAVLEYMSQYSTQPSTSSHGQQGLPEQCPPLPTQHVVLRAPIPVGPSLKIEVFYYQFFHHHPEMWVKYNMDPARNGKEIVKTYLSWSKMVKERKKRAAGESMGAKVESTKERLQRKIKQRVAEAEHAVRREWHAILKPVGEDEKRFLPTSRATHLVQTSCGPAVKLSSEAETALELLAQSFVEDSVGFSVAMARRRPRERGKQGQELRPSDAALFMKTAYNILLPASDGRDVRGYTCTTSLPKARAAREVVAAARKENLREEQENK